MKGVKKLLGVVKAKKFFLYTPLIKWHLQLGLRLTVVHHSVEYKPCKPFSWFPEEVVNARREAAKEPLKNNWVVLLEDLGRHRTTKHTREERIVDKSLRSPLFYNLEEIDGVFEIKELK